MFGRKSMPQPSPEDIEKIKELIESHNKEHVTVLRTKAMELSIDFHKYGSVKNKSIDRVVDDAQVILNWINRK